MGLSVPKKLAGEYYSYIFSPALTCPTFRLVAEKADRGGFYLSEDTSKIHMGSMLAVMAQHTAFSLPH